MTNLIKRARVGRRRDTERQFQTWDGTSEVIAFDTETTSQDFGQTLKVGAALFANRDTGNVRALTLFVGEHLADDDRATVKAYARDFPARLPRIVADQVDIRMGELCEAGDTTPRAVVAERIGAAFGLIAPRIKAMGRLPVWSRRRFAETMLDAMQGKVTWTEGMANDASAIIALNTTFDAGALAAPNTDQSPERGNSPVLAWPYEDAKQGAKGFCFHLCACERRTLHEPQRVQFGNRKGVIRRASCPDHPAIVSRILGGRKAQYGLSDRIGSAPILDLSVIGRAVLGLGDNSLRGLGDRLGAPILKRKGDVAHGQALTFEYLDYLVVDVIATFSVCQLLHERYVEHGLAKPIASMFSEASVGKAYLEAFGVRGDFRSRPFHPAGNAAPIDASDVDRLFARAQRSYQGARSEVMLRLTPEPVVLADFKSQYPSVNSLMGLQELWIASHYTVDDGLQTLERARDIIAKASHAWLGIKEHWRELRIVVKLRLGGCRLPIKRPDPDEQGRTIFGMANVPESVTLAEWYPLADAIASKLFTGRDPDIEDAFEIKPGSPIATASKNVFGRDIDLARDDLFVELIEHRTAIQDKLKQLKKQGLSNSPEYVVLNTAQNAAKLVSNSSAYGIFAETVMVGRGEHDGSFYAPFIATHITGGSRLLLALAETLARDMGRERFGQPIRHAMADTDSMAFVMPKGADYRNFAAAIDELRAYFSGLSPYRTDTNLFARELPNDDDLAAGRVLMFFGVSCKRYAMFFVGETVELQKVSSHGTGHIRFDNRESFADLSDDTADDDGDVDDTTQPVRSWRNKWSRDQDRMWTSAIERALGRRAIGPNEGRFAGFPLAPWNGGVMRKPVSVTTPGLMLEFAALGVRPGSFFFAMPERPGSKVRVCMPRAETSKAIMEGRFWDKVTGAELPRAQVDGLTTSIWAGTRDYFSIPERKATGKGKGLAQRPGWLDVPAVALRQMTERNRKGQRARNGQGELFS